MGHTAAVEEGEAWYVGYDIEVDDAWRTLTARVWSSSETGEREVRLEADASGHWLVDGVSAPLLDGCLDVDLESSACTNTLPVHRLLLTVGAEADAPAAYVRASDLRVERLEQRYARIDDEGAQQRYDYESPAHDFASRLTFDASGLAIDYPGIAGRVL